MLIGILLLGVGSACAVFITDGGPGSYLRGWVSISAFVMALAYISSWPRVMGKRPDGVVPWYRSALLLPFVLFTILMGNLKAWFGREPVFDEMVPGIYVGRRCSGAELPADVEVVVDLTCERTEPRALREASTYYGLFTLDGTAPEARAYRALLEKLIPDRRPMYIHCAMGHSRSATVAAGVLIGRDIVRTAAAAEQLMKRVRPKIHLTRAQRALVEALEQTLAPEERQPGD